MSLVERYARALGVWTRTTSGWSIRDRIDTNGPGSGFQVGHGERFDGWRDLDEPTALLWLRTLASGETLDVGLCGACVERGGGWEWCQAPWHLGAPDGEGWERGSHVTAWSGWGVAYSRPCPTCTTDGKPTGRDVRTLARLMVEAMPSPDETKTVSVPSLQHGHRLTLADRTEGHRPPFTYETRPTDDGWEWVKARSHPGDPAARERLATAADQLLDTGNPLGTWLALWLVGQCAQCHGHGCELCNGTGQALGSAQGELTRAALDAMRATTIDTAFGLARRLHLGHPPERRSP